jgi:hypothetical protein
VSLNRKPATKKVTMNVNRREILKFASGMVLTEVLRTGTAGAKNARPKLVFVHGRGQSGVNPETLKQNWLAALSRGARAIGMSVPTDVDIALPFYGDLLDRFTRDFRIPLTSDMRARGSAADDEYLVFQSDVAEAVRKQAGITDEQVDAEYGQNPAPRGPLNWQWVQAVLRAVDKYGFGMNQTTLEVFTRDVFLYTTRPGVQDEIDRVVAAKISDQPTVIVSHSLGTVVAYNVLRNDRRSLQIPLYLTLGSPLGIRAVRDQFRPLRSLESVVKWYNAMDTRDVVALYPLDSANFPILPAIENNTDVHNNTDNRHGIDGYLDDSNVARRIVQALSD